MSNQVISTPDAPADTAWSQVVKAENTIYVAATVGVDLTTRTFAGTTVQDQMRQSIRNCHTILRAGGGELADVVTSHSLLAGSEDPEGVTDLTD